MYPADSIILATELRRQDLVAAADHERLLDQTRSSNAAGTTTRKNRISVTRMLASFDFAHPLRPHVVASAPAR